MRIHRKILFGAAAIVLPVSTVALVGATEGVASAATITCSASGQVTFAPPGLSKGGSSSTDKTTVTTISGADLSCGAAGTGNIGGGTLSVSSKSTVKCTGVGQPSSTNSGCLAAKQWGYGSWSNYISGGVASIAKSLKKLSFTIGSTTYAAKIISSSVQTLAGGACTDHSTSQAGFTFQETVKSPKAAKGDVATVTACLGATQGSGGINTSNFVDNVGGPGTVTGATLDTVDSSVSLS